MSKRPTPKARLGLGGRPLGSRTSKTLPSAIETALRHAEALRHRLKGHSFDAIGKMMGVSGPRAHAIVTEALKRVVQEPAEEIRRMEAMRLDEILTGSYDSAVSGDSIAVGSVLKISERRAKLLGLDAATKQETTGTNEITIVGGLPVGE